MNNRAKIIEQALDDCERLCEWMLRITKDRKEVTVEDRDVINEIRLARLAAADMANQIKEFYHTFRRIQTRARLRGLDDGEFSIIRTKDLGVLKINKMPHIKDLP